MPQRSMPTQGYAPPLKEDVVRAQVSPTARQLGPGLGETGPPPTILLSLMSQIEAWPLVF
jgi:hypothetical protein